MRRIILENMEFHAYHGVLEHEKKEGNTFIVSLSIDFDTSIAGASDCLEDTLNYQWVYDAVKEEMETPSELIEHIAQRIMDHLMLYFPRIEAISLKLSKLNPPLGGKVEKVTIQLEERR